jgi:hypothetical protein
LEQFGEKIAMGDRISKLGARREQRQIAPGISSWGWDKQYLFIVSGCDYKSRNHKTNHSACGYHPQQM